MIICAHLRIQQGSQQLVQKTLLISNTNLRSRSGLLLSAQLVQFNFFIKLLAGLLYEAWRTIENRYGTLASQHHYALPSDAAECLKKLKQYFNSRDEPLVKYIRRKHAFHYDEERVAEGIDMVSRDEPLDVYMAEQGGNFFCPQAELMGNASLLAFANKSDVKRTVSRFMREVLVDVADMVTTFARGVSAMLLARAGAIRSPEDEFITASPRSSLELPYFMQFQNGRGNPDRINRIGQDGWREWNRRKRRARRGEVIGD